MENVKNISNKIGKASKSMIIAGALAIILGIIAIIYPASIGSFSTVVIGVFLILGGIIRSFFAIISFSIGSIIMRYLFAILMIIVGGWIIFNPDTGLEAITFALAAYFIIDGITAVIYSFSLMPLGGSF